MNMRLQISSTLLLSSVLLAAGCSDEKAANEVTMRKDCLANLGLVYHKYREENGRSPSSIDELAAYIQQNSQPGDEVSSESIKRLKEADIVMFWDSELADDPAENEKYVLGYETGIPRSGGYMVTGGGSVMLVTPNSFKEFKEYPKQAAPPAEIGSESNEGS